MFFGYELKFVSTSISTKCIILAKLASNGLKSTFDFWHVYFFSPAGLICMATCTSAKLAWHALRTIPEVTLQGLEGGGQERATIFQHLPTAAGTLQSFRQDAHSTCTQTTQHPYSSTGSHHRAHNGHCCRSHLQGCRVDPWKGTPPASNEVPTAPAYPAMVVALPWIATQ